MDVAKIIYHILTKQLINDKDRTVIIVSHAIETLGSLCDELLWLNDGEIKMQSNPEDVLKEYNNFMK